MSEPIIFYDNIFTIDTPTATTTDSDDAFDAANINDYRTYTYWKSTNSGTNYLYIDAGAADDADTLGIVSHNLGTVGATVSVESSTTNAWAGEEVEQLAGFAPSDDEAIMKTFTTANIRYWRIKITGGSAAYQLAVAFLGERIDMPERVKAVFVPENISIQAQMTRSKVGNILGSVIRHKPFTLAPEWNGLTYTFVNGTYLPFWEDHYSEMKPFFWSLDIGTFPGEIFYVVAPKNGRFRRPLLKNDRVESLVLQMEGIWE